MTRRRHAAILAVLLVALALRLYRLEQPSLWWDEGYSAFLAGQSLLEITRRSAADIHPPLYYYLLHFWTALAGQSEFALRYLSVALALLLIALLHRLGGRLFDPTTALAASVVAALSPFLLAYSQEARMYMLETVLGLVSAGLVWGLLRDYRRPTPDLPPRRGVAGRDWRWLAYVVATAAALYVDYFPVLILLGENLFVLGWLLRLAARRQGWRGLAWRWALAQALVVLIYLPWLGIGWGQVGGYGYARSTAPDAAGYLVAVWAAFNVGATVRVVSVVPYLLSIPTLLLGGLVLYLLPRRRRALDSLFLVLLYAVIPVVGLALVLIWRPFFHVRYLLVAMPGYCLLIGLAMATLGRSSRSLGVFAWAPLLVAWAVGIGSYFLDPAFARDDTRSTARFLEAEAGVGDLVLWETPYPFYYYYRGVARAEPLRITSPAAGAARLHDLAAGRRRVFWQTWYQGDGDPWGLVSFLLEREGSPLGSRSFPGYRVDWYELAPRAQFALGELAPVAANFEDRLALTGAASGYPRGLTALPGDRRPWVALAWRSLAPAARPLKFFLHVRDHSGHLVGQADGPILDHQGHPAPFWPPGAEALSFGNPQLLAGLPPGAYRLEVGVYEDGSGRRLGLVGGRTSVQPLGELTVERPLAPLPAETLEIGRRLGWGAGKIELLGVDMAPTAEAAAGETVALSLLWRALAAPDGDPQATLRLGEAGVGVAVPPLAGHPAPQWTPGEVVRQFVDFRISPEVGEGSHRLYLRLDSGQSDISAYELDISTITVRGRPRAYTLPAEARPVGAHFGEGIELAGYAVSSAAVPVGGRLDLTLYWRRQATGSDPGPSGWTVFTHLLDDQNQVWGQHDGLPASGQAPTPGWTVGEVVEDRHQLVVKEGAAPGEYELEVGLYAAVSGDRLPLVDGGDRVLLGRVAVQP